ncbi:hypothetical protein Syn1_083 [Prochlorococcus phage Syn1]|uniref:Uncharacterized protein n=1 Tax=Prochlorococcus phage Syn1 TaxID=444861 RepID=E3SPG8_9CAUD|nr:hypothetical protein Syn1_083 [Prochlorococcus phage Syn1]ADO99184.1 hypothetical protein Syn1_083 [Prochlorococcus phage Syn1]
MRVIKWFGRSPQATPSHGFVSMMTRASPV